METWKWTKFENLGNYPQPKTAPSLNYLDGVLYLVGGEADASPDPYKPEFYKYDLSSYSWEEVSALKSFVNRNLHGSCIFDNYLYLFYGWSNLLNSNVDSIDRIQLNSSSATWEKLEVEPTNENLLRSTYGYACSENKVYMFGGYSAQTLRNSVLQFDLSQLPLTYQFLAHDYYGPLSRTEHSLVVINAEFYLFGGINNERVLGDFWKYNEALNKWSEIQVEGTSPSARMRHAADSFADNMLIWGGENESGLLNDIYIYNAFLESWRAIEVSGTLIPSPRRNLCLIMAENEVFLYGGMTEAGLSDELWKFDIRLGTYTLLNEKDQEGPGPLSTHTCTLESERIYVMLGKARSDEPRGSVHYFDLRENRWFTVLPNDKSSKKRSEATVLKLDDEVFVLGGTIWNLQGYGTFFSINLKNLEYTDYQEIQDVSFGAAYVYFKDSLYVHGGGSSSGSAIRNKIPSNTFFKINIRSIRKVTKCSPGTYESFGECSLCPPGTFSFAFGVTECELCPAGTFNPYYGASSVYECKPCYEGTFSSGVGNSRCYSCVTGSYCPVGSIKASSDKLEPEFMSIQPSIEEEIDQESSEAAYELRFYVGSIGFIFLGLFYFSEKLRKKLKGIDLYSDSHNYAENKPMYIKSSKIGGAFSLIFILTGVFIIGQALIYYTMSNILETKTLVPFVVMNKRNPQVSGDFEIQVKLYSFGTYCLVDGVCNPDIEITHSNIQGNLKFACSVEESQQCSVSFACKHCRILTGAYLKIEVSHVLSYSSAIELKMDVNSSIPNQNSTLIQRILSDYPKVFLGYQPTVFSVSAIPSVTLT